jgi:hypothetical protein
LGGDVGGNLVGDLGDALGRCPGNTRGMPKVKLKTHFKKMSLLSRVFSWDLVDVGFPTCLYSS